MFSKSTVTFALFAIASRVAVAAQPPACMLAAISVCPDPSDIKSVCNNANVTSTISKSCGANTDAAVSWFDSACKSAGVSVSLSTSSSASGTKSASATGSGSVSTGTAGRIPVGYGSGSMMATAPLVTATGSPSGFVTGSSSSPTGGASNGTLPSTAGTAGPTTTGSSASATHSGAYTGVAARLGMDLVGLGAIGAFGAMLAL